MMNTMLRPFRFVALALAMGTAVIGCTQDQPAGGSTQPGATATPAPSVGEVPARSAPFEGMRTVAAAQGSVRVLARLNPAVSPEAELASESLVDAQRVRLRADQSTVLCLLEGRG